MKNESYIYKITNMVNNKVYVGQTYDVKYRWSHHKSDLTHHRHHNIHLQSAWDKYGEENFKFEIIEQCLTNEVDEREQFWISKYDSYHNGYNLDLGGNGTRGYKHTDEELNKMRRIQNPKIVLQFDLNFNFVKEWIGGVSHVNKVLHYTKECILLRCEHTILNKMTPYKNSYWIYKDEYDSEDFSWDKYFSNISYANDIIICQYDKHFNLIKEWFRHELRDQNYNLKAIISICNRNSDQKIYMDSIWAYKGDSVTDGYFGNGLYYQYKRKIKRVNMKLTKDGEIIKTFDAIIDACKYLNRPKKFLSNICSAIRLNQRAGGYYWEYAN